MIWWAVEPHSNDIDRVLGKLQWNERFWTSSIANQRIAPNLIEIWAKANSPRSMAAISHVLKKIGEQPAAIRNVAAKHANDAFERAFVGRSLLGVPDGVIDALISLGQPSLTLRLRRGDVEAKSQAKDLLFDTKQTPAKRIQMVQLFGELHDLAALPNLIKIATSAGEVESVRAASLSAMTGFDTPDVPTAILKTWPELSPALRAVGGSVLGARKSWTVKWVGQASAGKVDAKTMPMECIRAMRLHNDENLQSQINKLYPGLVGPDLAQAQKDVANLLERIGTTEGDPYRGKVQFKANCARCHKLYAEGGEIGPDLTGYQRDQLHALVRNIIAPSLEIREGYQTVGVRMEDGSVLTGFIENQNDEQITLRAVDGKSHVLAKSELDQMLPQSSSLMPEGMLNSLTDQQIADLLAYLRSSQPLSDG
jgi:putative heme-binding domain-containing protein